MRYPILVLLVLTALLACCVAEKHRVEVYFYYSPYCPHCRAVEPYMKLLKEKLGDEVEFYFCNVNDPRNCSKKAIDVARRYPFEWIPTVIVFADGKVYRLTGTDQVLRLGDILKEYGINPPPAKLGKESFSVEYCIRCHEERGLPPPSNFTCDRCCHRGRL